MEKFELDNEKNVEIFSNFIGRTKDVLATLIKDIKESIKEYERKIKNTTKEITDNEDSREKCDQEIEKMEGTISEIKDAIENVESTYQKIVDAYSSTSKGETKELYSEIIESARLNCERDVEKNKTEIAHLNSDIESVKVSIAEYSKIIDSLNEDLDGYNLELYKYNKVLEYMEKTAEKTALDLDDISNKKDLTKKIDSKTSKRTETRRTNKSKDSSLTETDVRPSVLDTLKEEAANNIEDKPKRQDTTVESNSSNIDFEDSLKQIYDMANNVPTMEETSINDSEQQNKSTYFDFSYLKDTEPTLTEAEEKKIYSDNLESLFSNREESTIEVEEPKKESSFLEEDYLNWENILNSNESEMKPAEPTPTFNVGNTVDELLNPYGTSYERLKSLTSNTICYRDGSKVPFDITEDDIVKAINAIDGIDLRHMKTVGPEITLLRKVKMIKEGNL